ncbi:hypothetical protein [Methylocystis parvus]|uniref:hypothetical protein n=1 Tax=Methylocystis parvus TaxID=134 RepID=UPI003C736FF7
MSIQSLPAQAALTRVWVSGQGVDAPSCGALAAPCRQIKYVLDNGLVAPGGEIDIRDAAGFAPFTITQSVSIVNDGAGVASIQATSTSNAIDIMASQADGIFLKGLTIDGMGTDAIGIRSLSAGRLVILRCTIKNIRIGIATSNLVSTARNLNLKVSDVTIDNVRAGIDFSRNDPAGTVAGEISRVNISNSIIGIAVYSSTSLLTDVTITGSTRAGIEIGSQLRDKSTPVVLRRCTITNSAVGVQNWTTMSSYGDNSIIGNGKDIFDPAAVTRVNTQ